jgi:hypothetical protein
VIGSRVFDLTGLVRLDIRCVRVAALATAYSRVHTAWSAHWEVAGGDQNSYLQGRRMVACARAQNVALAASRSVERHLRGQAVTQRLGAGGGWPGSCVAAVPVAGGAATRRGGHPRRIREAG